MAPKNKQAAPPPKASASSYLSALYDQIQDITDAAPNPNDLDLDNVLDPLCAAFEIDDAEERNEAWDLALTDLRQLLTRIAKEISETNRRLEDLTAAGLPLDNLNGIVSQNAARPITIPGTRQGRLSKIMSLFKQAHPDHLSTEEPMEVTRLRYELEDLAADIGPGN